MDGDLSLSQSFGGLRIANPDDSSVKPGDKAPSSADTTSHPPQTSSPATAGDGIPSQLGANINAAAKAPDPSSQAQSNLSSVAYGYENPPQQHYSQYADPKSQTSNPAPAPAPAPAPSPANIGHPMSAYYAQPVTNGSSSNMVPREGYRLRTESSPLPTSESQSRSDSRGGSAALQAGVPVQDSSHSERTYKQTQFHSGSSPLPPRRSSRVAHNNGASPLSGSPYGIENVTLSSSEEWHDRGAAVGVRQEIDANGKPVSRYVKKGVRDFSFGRTLGEGSYSTVVAATDRQTLKEYAIKILDKRHIIKEKKVKYVNIEKDTLNRLTDHPGVVRLYYTFQDERSLYFVLDLASGGELLGVLKRMSSFDEECTRFYGAQILDTIDYMHKRGVIHRDLKPENVLLDSQMHVKITDFGTAKMLDRPKRQEENSSGIPQMDSDFPDQEDRANSFVGTAEYVSPELLTDKSAYKASDLWAFGCIIYQLLAGRPPFKGANEYQTFQKIVGLDYEFPPGFPAVARDLVERLLVLDPSRRLQMEHIKNHEFFDGIVWGRGLWKQKAPRLKPYVPPLPEPIKLNGSNKDDSFPSNITKMGLGSSGNSGSTRNYPRLVTDLPPPSQLDIEWSPVLTRTNERILKMGNLLVLSSPAPHNQHGKGGHGDGGDAPKKFSRFFGGNTTKKRHRLVMVTSAGRVIIAPAGGEEKKAKMDISLLAPGAQYRSTTDAKGFSSWIVDTREKHYVFEDARPSSNDVASSALSTQEWIDTLDHAKELAVFQSANNNNSSYDDTLRDISSGVSSNANTIDNSVDFASVNVNLNAPQAAGGRATLVKHHGGTGDAESVKGKKRFSRRHSKNGLSAVF
ncbi:AGC/PDK1 protein kinase [Paracoccidioides brasiliensis Pb18]|uniref:non-specific serine/threonine protein kinase n=1 Tax=Paracoccidioides brasiliensis (strain Pb18) TaxID=502780 RepID=C1FYN4_PARBD|nr:AGC/PDK1 protein kinase [Paracoccidioides brasiliensis Pb18]EEH44621.1 AGC/PDK1 protein kinase [Paracoccidioides brasiliensis Pb18]